jgi:hypothetical protein
MGWDGWQDGIRSSRHASPTANTPVYETDSRRTPRNTQRQSRAGHWGRDERKLASGFTIVATVWPALVVRSKTAPKASELGFVEKDPPSLNKIGVLFTVTTPLLMAVLLPCNGCAKVAQLGTVKTAFAPALLLKMISAFCPDAVV